MQKKKSDRQLIDNLRKTANQHVRVKLAHIVQIGSGAPFNLLIGRDSVAQEIHTRCQIRQ
jgi:hypothetical protein